MQMRYTRESCDCNKNKTMNIFPGIISFKHVLLPAIFSLTLPLYRVQELERIPGINIEAEFCRSVAWKAKGK